MSIVSALLWKNTKINNSTQADSNKESSELTITFNQKALDILEQIKNHDHGGTEDSYIKAKKAHAQYILLTHKTYQESYEQQTIDFQKAVDNIIQNKNH